jgi:sodium pump decarboxylase gamma subunit
MNQLLTESFGLLFIGMGGVFAVLTFFYLLIMVMNKINQSSNAKKAEQKLGVSADKAEEMNPDDINPEILAVISAAVFATLQEKVKIKTIRFLTQPDDTSWSRIGRLSLIESHIIKK